jgi:hypothetical protein
MSNLESRATVIPDRWLLLTHQLPAKPAYLRVKVWRRLQALGSVAVKNGVYALPFSDQSQEDFDWLLKEISEGGGEAVIWDARLVDGLTDGEIRAQFDAARDADYAAITAEVRALAKRLSSKASAATRAEVKSQLAKLKARHAEVIAVDFFGANGREIVDGLVTSLDAALTDDATAGDVEERAVPSKESASLKDRIWVTRQGVQVDRIASAWLIKRFIDDKATLKFVPPRGYVQEPGELRFDMFQAEFTHEGDRCTFEVLLARSGLKDRALTAIAEIVHDIDLKDSKYGREETSGVRTLLAGICAGTSDDDERVARGGAIFDNLYAVFGRSRAKETRRR